jgi:hypothetical protein
MDEKEIKFYKKMLNNAKGRAKRKGIKFDLSIKDIINHKNVCPISLCLVGINYSGTQYLFSPSIDRIDSNKGYTSDNIQITSYWANLAKNKFSDEEAKSYFQSAITNIMSLLMNRKDKNKPLTKEMILNNFEEIVNEITAKDKFNKYSIEECKKSIESLKD